MNLLMVLIVTAIALSLIVWGILFLAFLIRYKLNDQDKYDARLKSATTRQPTDEEWLEWTVRKQASR